MKLIFGTSHLTEKQTKLIESKIFKSGIRGFTKDDDSGIVEVSARLDEIKKVIEIIESLK